MVLAPFGRGSAIVLFWKNCTPRLTKEASLVHDDDADVLADADAWFLAKAMQDDTSGLSLSNAMRTVYQEDGDTRIARFYSERFGGSADNVSAAYVPLMGGIDIGPITNFPLTLQMLKAAAGSSGSRGGDFEMPSPAQADICARAYAAFLAHPHR